MNCIFCKIVKNEINAKKVYEDDEILAFYDVNPVTPTHILFIPKSHIISANDINAENSAIIGKIFCAISKVAKNLNLSKGYRIINNCGKNAGQTVMHIHFHLLAGKQMGWPGID